MKGGVLQYFRSSHGGRSAILQIFRGGSSATLQIFRGEGLQCCRDQTLDRSIYLDIALDISNYCINTCHLETAKVDFAHCHPKQETGL